MPELLDGLPHRENWRSRFRRMPPAERLRWLDSDQALLAFAGVPQIRQRLIRELRKLRRRLELQACSDAWLEDAWAHGVRYAPNSPCACDHCRLRRLWPSGRYVGSRGISFECFIEGRTAKWYLAPSSPSGRAIQALGELTSIDAHGRVRRGGRLMTAVRMLPESEAALRREIARFHADGTVASDRRNVNPRRVRDVVKGAA